MWLLVKSRKPRSTKRLFLSVGMYESIAIAIKPSLNLKGNVVAPWERLAEEVDNIVDLRSDQPSLHNPFNGGYYTVALTFEESHWFQFLLHHIVPFLANSGRN